MLTDKQKKRCLRIGTGAVAVLALILVWVSCNDNRSIPNGVNTAVPTTEVPGTTEVVYQVDVPAIEQK